MNTLNQNSLKTKNGLPYLEAPEVAELGWVRHAFLTRRGGVSLSPYESLNLSDKNGDQEELVSQNKKRVATAFCFDSSRLILLDQMQQDQIVTLPSPLEYDAMITNFPNIFLGILTADCLPIFAIDQKKKVIAAIHAGRQGTSLQITRKVLKKMTGDFGCSSRDFIVAMGASIGSCCYEIDEEVFHPEWKPFSTAKGAGKWTVDLARINIEQMKSEGIKEEQISWINLCTRCHTDLFFSYRGEGRTGRQLSFIGII
jgi:hypothetical protein